MTVSIDDRSHEKWSWYQCYIIVSPSHHFTDQTNRSQSYDHAVTVNLRMKNNFSPVFVAEFGYFTRLQDNVFFQFISWNWILEKLSFKSCCLVYNLQLKKKKVQGFSEKLSHVCIIKIFLQIFFFPTRLCTLFCIFRSNILSWACLWLMRSEYKKPAGVLVGRNTSHGKVMNFDNCTFPLE